MSVPYKNPISSVQVSTPQSVSRTSVFGTNFSTLNVGGYMEVYNLSDLSLTLTASTYPSLIQLSANTIPIRFTKGNNTFLSPDYLTLNSDNISSGRRRLGMLVYVHETDKVYQYVIPNYDTLWDNLSGLTGFSSVTYSDYTTVINTRSSAGQTFINSWTASTIEGVSGYTSTNANWRILQSGGGGTFTGGTVTGPTIFTNGLTANTISATTYQNLPIDIRVTGGTKSGSNVTFTNNTGGTFNVTGFTDTFVTGGTYIVGTSTFTNNSGGTFSVTGFSKYFVTGSTPSGYTINNGDRWYNTTSGIELVYFDDGSSSQWVQPPNTPGPAGYSNLLTTTGITVSSTTLDINYNYYGVNYNGIVNITLPNPSGYDGRNINIKDEGGYAGTYRIRLIPSVGLIDGNSYVDMNINYISLHIVARNNNWWII
jgi:hypothetical protein